MRDRTDKEITLADFIQWSRSRASSGVADSKSTRPIHTAFIEADSRVPAADELLYGKDAPCPREWRDWVNDGDLLPSVLCPQGSADLFRNLTKEVLQPHLSLMPH